MMYLLIPLAIAVIAFVYSKNKKAEKHKLFMAMLMDNWGKPSDEYRNIDIIKTYHEHYKTDSAVAENVAVDIDLDNLFNFADRTCSKPGQQYLYHTLRSPTDDVEQLKKLDELSEKLTADENIRTQIQLELFRLDDKNAYYLHQLFTQKHPPLYNGILSIYIRLAWAIWICLVILTIVLHVGFVFLLTLGVTIFNFYLHYSNKANILKYIHSLPQLYLLSKVAKNINAKAETPDSDAVKKHLSNLRDLNRSLRFVSFDDGVSGDPTDISSAVWELIKTILLIEPAMFIKSISKIILYRDDIEGLFNYVGRFDTAISIQSLRLSLPYYSKPVLNTGNDTLSVTGLFHPLVETCVPNSLKTADSKGVLITGSNMSGKTTFIRAMGINVLLSQTLFTSCTQSYQAPPLQLLTSIRVSDDIEEHKSYFQSEALSVLHIMNQSKGVKSLVIIDEIFRGTNTIERVSAAKAILSYFTANKSFVFVSTHDLELAELLGNEYAIYCFEEQVADTRLVFDYKIKPGILKNKNAIAIMAGLGYPESVIADAYKMSDALRGKYGV
jgi:DNA mismatch repair ATPase MutS